VIALEVHVEADVNAVVDGRAAGALSEERQTANDWGVGGWKIELGSPLRFG
jgi:hypothetical protein